MEMKALVVEVSVGDDGVKRAKVVARVSSRYMADAMSTGLQRMQDRGEISDRSGFMYCDADRFHHTMQMYGYDISE